MMILHELMAKNNMSIYRLSKDSGVPYATVNDLAFIIEATESEKIRDAVQLF